MFFIADTFGSKGCTLTLPVSKEQADKVVEAAAEKSIETKLLAEKLLFGNIQDKEPECLRMQFRIPEGVLFLDAEITDQGAFLKPSAVALKLKELYPLNMGSFPK